MKQPRPLSSRQFELPFNYARSGLPRIASTALNIPKQQRLHIFLDQIARRTEAVLHQQSTHNTASIIISRPQDLRLRIKGRTRIRRPPPSQYSEQDREHQKQKIITNRTLLIKFAEKIRPTNASLSKRQRLNMRIAANTIANSTKQSENLNVLDRILETQHSPLKLPDKLEVELRNNIAKRQALAHKIKLQVKSAIDHPMRNVSVASL